MTDETVAKAPEPDIIKAEDAVGTQWRWKGDPDKPNLWRPAFLVCAFRDDPRPGGRSLLSMALETCGWIGEPGHVSWGNADAFEHWQSPERGEQQIVQVDPGHLRHLVEKIPTCKITPRPGTPPSDEDMEHAYKVFAYLQMKLDFPVMPLPILCPRDRILREKDAAEAAKAHYERIRQQEQDKCEHPEQVIVEGKAKPGDTWTIGCGGGTYSTWKPPFRVCRACGYAEEGWGSGYWKLGSTPRVPEIERAEAKKLILGRALTQRDLYKLEYPHRFTNRTDENGAPTPLYAWKEIE